MRIQPAVILTLLIVSLCGIRATPLAYNTITVAGEQFVQSLDSADLAGVPKWKFGDGEPPVLPNRAAVLATTAFAKQFGARVRAALQSVTLFHTRGTDCVYYEVLFVEELTPEEREKRTPPPDKTGVSVTHVANIRYFVLLDGRVIGPRKNG
jgi:hypothetical protein